MGAVLQALGRNLQEHGVAQGAYIDRTDARAARHRFGEGFPGKEPGDDLLAFAARHGRLDLSFEDDRIEIELIAGVPDHRILRVSARIRMQLIDQGFHVLLRNAGEGA